MDWDETATGLLLVLPQNQAAEDRLHPETWVEQQFLAETENYDGETAWYLDQENRVTQVQHNLATLHTQVADLSRLAELHGTTIVELAALQQDLHQKVDTLTMEQTEQLGELKTQMSLTQDFVEQTMRQQDRLHQGHFEGLGAQVHEVQQFMQHLETRFA